MFNSDDPAFGGSGVLNELPAQVEWVESHGKESSVAIRIPPLGAVFLEGEGTMPPKPKKRKASVRAAGKKPGGKGAAPEGPAKKKSPAKAPKQATEKTTKKRGTSK